MSLLALPSGPARPARRLGLIAWIREFVDAVREGLELATRYKLLAGLNDQELATIGLKREDIPRVVVSGWKH
jgi:uncharacterized protein YjiS (DUF1127 family)